MFKKIMTLSARFDLGFIGARLGLVLPIAVFAHLLDSPDFFGEFSKSYHTALFLGNLAIYGAHERFLVERESPAALSNFYQIALRTVLIGVLAWVAAYSGWLSFSIAVWIFLFFFRSIPFYLFSITKQEPPLYFVLGIGLGACFLLLPFCEGEYLVAVIPLALASSYVLYKKSVFKGSTLQHAKETAIRDYPEGFHYFLNLMAASLFIQGTLFVYTFLVDAATYAHATHYVYLLQLSLIIQSLVYRVLLSFVAEQDGKTERKALFRKANLLITAITLVSSVVLYFEYPLLEQIVFGRSVLDSSQMPLLIVTLFSHSYNMSLASFLVGSGNVKIQSIMNILNGLFLFGLLIVMTFAQIGHALEIALLVSSLISFILRFVAVRKTVI